MVSLILFVFVSVLDELFNIFQNLSIFGQMLRLKFKEKKIKLCKKPRVTKKAMISWSKYKFRFSASGFKPKSTAHEVNILSKFAFHFLLAHKIECEENCPTWPVFLTFELGLHALFQFVENLMVYIFQAINAILTFYFKSYFFRNLVEIEIFDGISGENLKFHYFLMKFLRISLDLNLMPFL